MASSVIDLSEINDIGMIIIWNKLLLYICASFLAYLLKFLEDAVFFCLENATLSLLNAACTLPLLILWISVI